MPKTPHILTALCTLALAGATVAFAQDPSSEQEAPQQSPQQPVYYAVPAQTQNVQYVIMPAAQAPQPQQTYMATPQPQPKAIPPKTPAESRISFFTGIDMNFYASTESFEEDRKFRYESDYEATHSFDGKGFNAGITVGVLFRDIAGLHALFNIGEQSGKSNYWNDSRKNSDYHTESSAVDVAFGVSGTFFPFNMFKGALYNSYIDGTIGMSIHEFDDEFAVDFGRAEASTAFIKLELGKLYPISKYWNIGFGVAYIFEFLNDDYIDTYEKSSTYDRRHSIWAGIRFAIKRNKN